MNLDKFKREYNYKSQEGAHGGGPNKWLIIIGGVLVIILAYLVSHFRG